MAGKANTTNTNTTGSSGSGSGGGLFGGIGNAFKKDGTDKATTTKTATTTTTTTKDANPKTTIPTTIPTISSSSFDKAVEQWSKALHGKWDELCDKLEQSENEYIRWITQTILRKLTVEAPVIVGFTFLCVTLHLLNMTILPGVSVFLGVDSSWSTLRTNIPMQYIRMFTHIMGHDGLIHLRNNMTNMLLVGPSAEAAFGSFAIVQIMIVVAISTAVAHMMVGKRHSRQLGASGFIFALILLNSLASAKCGKIPISFVLTALLWLVDEFIWLFFNFKDNTSHHAHLVGGIVGAIAGFYIHQQNEKERLRNITSTWRASASASAATSKKKE